MTLPDEFAAPLAALPARGCPVRVAWHRSLPSTMDAAADLAEGGAPHGTVVVAGEQTAGRGRRGTAWASPPGAGVYFSFVARPGRHAATLLTLAAGVGVRAGIAAATGLAADLKWPNDLLAGRRKLAGILAEGQAIGSDRAAVVVGVGVNVQPAAYPPDVQARATALETELGRSIDRGMLLAEMLASLWSALADLERSPGDILRAWRAAAPSAMGTMVEWDGRRGTTAGIDDAGALLVRTEAGLERIIAGDLQWHLTAP